MASLGHTLGWIALGGVDRYTRDQGVWGQVYDTGLQGQSLTSWLYV